MSDGLEIQLYCICAAAGLPSKDCEEVSGVPRSFMEGVVFDTLAKLGYRRRDVARAIALKDG